MAYPPNLGFRAVTGTFLQPNGNPITSENDAWVVFTAQLETSGGMWIKNMGSTPPSILVPTPQKVLLDANGQFSTFVMATDDTDLVPRDWTWQVEIKMLAFSYVLFRMTLPMSGSARDLSQVIPL